MATPQIALMEACSGDDWQAARELVAEYTQSLGIDLAFQQLDQEMAQLHAVYAPPKGAFLLARVDDTWAGCCALRALPDTDYPNAAEMKRLYVRPAFRRFGLGRSLSEGILDAARRLGYHCVLLDTLDDMEAARSLYEELGFEDIPPYYHNPIAGAHYLKVDL
jgi:putative acetyltransferase